jgi:nucleoid DNA-binding protein
MIKKNQLAKENADARPEIFVPGNALDAMITDLDLEKREVNLSVKAAQIYEEKSLVAKFGVNAAKSGATLAGIFQKALGKKPSTKKKEEESLVKSEFIKLLQQKHPAFNRSQIQVIIDIMFDTIKGSLIKNKPVELRNFGRFSIKTIKAKYNARNPKTGESIYVPEKKKVSFKMSKHLKQQINK